MSKTTLIVLILMFLVTVITAVMCFLANQDNSESPPPEIEIVLPKGGKK